MERCVALRGSNNINIHLSMGVTGKFREREVRFLGAKGTPENLDGPGSLRFFDGTIHRAGVERSTPCPTTLAPSRPVSNFCHCYWPVPLFCVPLRNRLHVSVVIVVGVISHPSLDVVASVWAAIQDWSHVAS